MDFYIATKDEFPKLPLIKEQFNVFRVLVYDFKKMFYVEVCSSKGIIRAFGKTKKKALKKALKRLKPEMNQSMN